MLENSTENKCRWIVDDVKIDFPVPKTIQDKIDELERLDQENNDLYFDNCEFLDDACKFLYLEGIISKKQWDTIVSRYDWRVGWL